VFLRWLLQWAFWRKWLAPPRPGPLTLGEQREITLLRYTVNLPPAPPITDLATREVTIKQNGAPTIRPLSPDDGSFQFDCAAGTAVELTLVDIDESGNRSDPSGPLAFTATDTVPPPQPGGMNVAGVEQID